MRARKVRRAVRATWQRGSVQLKNGRWTLRYKLRTEAGWKHCREILTCQTRKQAQELASRRMVEINERNNRRSSGRRFVTFGEFVRVHWPSYLEARQAKPSTVYSYESMLRRHILPRLADRRLEAITSEEITITLDSLKGSRKYRQNVYGLLSVIFEVARDYGFIPESPVKRKLHRPQQRRIQKPALTAAQIRELVRELPNEQTRLLALMIVSTGLRIGEALALRWQDLEPRARLLHVQGNLWRGQIVEPKTIASGRAIHLSDALCQLLEAHRERCPENEPQDFIFNRSGAPLDPDHLRNAELYPALRRMGIEPESRRHGWHLLRHSSITLVYEATRDPKAAQEFARHSRISTTADVYIHAETISGEATEMLARELGIKAETGIEGWRN